MSTRAIRRPTISGSKLKAYLKCKRLPYLDVYGDRSRAISVEGTRPAFSAIDREDPIIIVPGSSLDIVETSPFLNAPAPPYGTTGEAAWTLAQMRKGTEIIAHGYIKHDNWHGRPEWLVRRQGPSIFGSWHYEVCGTRWRRADSHKKLAVPLTFYSLLLEKVQNRRPENIMVLSPSHEEEDKIPVAEHEAEARLQMLLLEESLQRERDPGPLLKAACQTCQWLEVCQEDAKREGHLTLLPNMREATLVSLHQRGIRDLRELAAASPEQVQRIPYTRPGAAGRLVAQAQAYISGVPKVAGVPALPRSEVEVFLDFEANSVTGDIFLAGLLVRKGKKIRPQQFLARSERDVSRVVASTIKELSQLPQGTPIFHYGVVERNLLTEHAPRRISRLNLIDVYPLVHQHAGVASRSLGLKDVAKSLGVRSRKTLVDGRTAPVFWWEWLQSGDATIRSRLLAYNLADCRMLAVVTDWLRGLHRPKASRKV